MYLQWSEFHTTGQTGRVETAIRPEWLAHIEAGPRVRGRVVMQSITVFYSLPILEKGFYTCGIPPTLSSHGLIGSEISLSRSKKGWKKSFQPKWFVLIVGKLTGENRAVDMPTCFHLPTLFPPIVGGLVEATGSTQTEWFTDGFWLHEGSTGNIQVGRSITHHFQSMGCCPEMEQTRSWREVPSLWGTQGIFHCWGDTLHKDPRDPSSAGKRK